MLQLIPKGSAAIDGISLTIIDVKKTAFTFAAVPHTLEATTLGEKKPGDAVNLEADVLGKYVNKLLGKESGKSNLTEDFLAEHGFM
jgi:riboflavin synthase